MYKKVVFETASEFFSECAVGGIIPDSVYVVFEEKATPFLSGDGAKEFQLSPKISMGEMVEEAFIRAGSRIHYT